MAYHRHDGSRRRWFRNQRIYSQPRRTLRVVLPLRIWFVPNTHSHYTNCLLLTSSHRCLLCQFRHSRLGLRYTRTNYRKESRFAVHCQRRFDGEFHLHTLFVPRERWSQVRYCYEQ